MNADVFDGLARRFALVGEPAGTRRALLAALGVGVGAVALGGGSAGAAPAVGARVGSAEAGRAQEQPRSLPTLVEELAFELEYDIAKIATFVADEIRYEPYAGALRGPIGTIWAGAGNAVDQAQLLAALLAASRVPVRFAVGTAEAEALRGQHGRGIGRGVSAVIDRVISAHVAAAYPELDPALIRETPPPDARSAALRAEILTEAATRVDVMGERLTEVLREAGLALVEGAVAVPDAETLRHVWVQYASGRDWVDLDPSLPGSVPSAGSPSPETLDAIPDDWFHTITFTVSHDRVADGTLERVTSLEHTVRSQDMTNGSLALVHLDGDELTTMGFDLGAVLEGSRGSFAMILAGSEFFYATEPMTFGGQGGVLDVFEDAAGTGEGEAVAEFLDVEVRSPGAEPLVASRTIFDRVAGRRGQAALDLAGLEAVTFTDLGAEKSQYLPLAPYRAFAAIAGPVPPRYSLLKAPLETVFNAFSDATRGMQAARQAIAAAGATAVAVGVIDRPNLVSYTYSPAPDAEGSLTALEIAADLLVQSLRGVSEASATPFGILAGVTAHLAEETALDPRLLALIAEVEPPAAPRRAGASVARIFGEAEAQGVAWSVVTALDDLSARADGLPTASMGLIAGHLEDGRVILLPEGPVIVDGAEALGWWVYDPVTGELFDQSGDGRSLSIVGYAVQLRNAVVAQAGFLFTATCVAAVTSAANDVLSGDLWGGVAGAVMSAGACA